MLVEMRRICALGRSCYDLNMANERMLFTIPQVSVKLTARFRSPAFELAENQVDTLRALYEKIGPRYTVDVEDLKRESGAKLSDNYVRMDLFGDLGHLQITADRFEAAFRNVIGENDVKIIIDCVNQGLAAVREALPSASIAEEWIYLAFPVRLENADAAHFLERFGNPGIMSALRNISAISATPGIKLELQNADDGWQMNFDLDCSSIVQTDLSTVVGMRFYGKALSWSFDEQVVFVKSHVLTFLGSLGLELKT